VNEPTARHGRGRSVGAVLAGFVATAVLSLGADALMHATGVFPPWGQTMSDGLYVWATVYRVVFTVFGGFVTARVAARTPMTHVVVLGVVGVIAATAGTLATWNQGPEFGPKWYPLLLVVTALPCVWIGGVLAGRVVERRSAGATTKAADRSTAELR
jgi:peptidoglycan/LPS O-acetylase OafA/YrhL